MRVGGAPGGCGGGDGSGAAGIPWLCLTGGGVKPKNKGMLRLIAPLLLLLQAFAAMAPVGGVELCLGIPGGRDATPAETSCGCGHHAEDPKSDLPAAPDEPGAPLDSEVCVDLELVAEEALPVDLEGGKCFASLTAEAAESSLARWTSPSEAPRRARRRAPPRAAPPSRSAALRHRVTVQVLR